MQFGSLLCISLVLALTACPSCFAIGHGSGHHRHTAFFPSSLSPFFRRQSIHNTVQSGKDGTIA